MTTEIRTTAEVLEKHRKGEPILDDELAVAIKTLKPTVALLDALGDRFHFCWREMYNRLDQLEDFAIARKITRSKPLSDTDSSYRGTKKFDREQLVFIVETAMYAAFDHIASSLPTVVPLEYCPEAVHEVIHGCKATIGHFVPILYAQLTNDGMGIGDFDGWAEFEKLVDDLTHRRTRPGYKEEPGELYYPDCRELAEKIVDKAFDVYLDPTLGETVV